MNTFTSKSSGQFLLIWWIVDKRSIFQRQASFSFTVSFVFTTVFLIIDLFDFYMIVSSDNFPFFRVTDRLSHSNIFGHSVSGLLLNRSYRTRYLNLGTFTHLHQRFTCYVFQTNKFIFRFGHVLSNSFWLHVLLIPLQFLCTNTLKTLIIFDCRIVYAISWLLGTFFLNLSAELLRTESIEEIVHNIFNRWLL